MAVMEAIARNKKAYFDYKIADDLEVGLALLGPEIKAIRAKQVNMNGSYIRPFVNENGKNELWWVGSHFTLPTTDDQTRSKKLLLHRTEIERLVGKLTAKGFTILPLELYFKRGRAKLKIGLGERKKAHDHRDELRSRDLNREIERDWRESQKK